LYRLALFCDKINFGHNDDITKTRLVLPMRVYVSADISRYRVCLSVTRRYCVKTAKRRITQTAPHDSPGILVFWTNSRWWATPLPPEICAQSDAVFTAQSETRNTKSKQPCL